MRYTELIKDYLHLEVALDRIKNNYSNSYQWYAVKNKKGSFIEVGGIKHNIKAYITQYINGKISVYQNGYVNTIFSIDNKGEIAYPSYYLSHNMNQEEFINFLDNTDFSTYISEILEEEIQETSYRTVKTFIK